MENDKGKLKIFVHPIFDPVYETFHFFIATLPMIIQEDFQKMILNSNNRYGELELSSKIYGYDILNVDMKYIFEYINKKIGLQKNVIGVKANFSNIMESFGRIMAISLFNITESSKFNNKLNRSEIYQFAKYIRHGAAHGNIFTFEPKVKKRLLNKPVIWRDKKIEAGFEGKEVFNSFITCFDLIFVMYDLSVEIKSIEGRSIKL